MNLPDKYQQRFNQILKLWEEEKSKSSQAATKQGEPIHKMRTFDQSNMSKKARKKEEKKKALAETQNNGDEEGTTSPDQSP